MIKIIPYIIILSVICTFSKAQEALVHEINVNQDGSFTPQYLYVHEGDTVQWNFQCRTDNIIPVDSIGREEGLIFNYRTFDKDDPNEFTGPLPVAVSGVFTQSPESPPEGFQIHELGESNCTPEVLVGNQLICSDGDLFATMDWTWEQPAITGVNIRMRWNEINTGPGEYDWSVLDREVQKAVENGKMYNLTFKAGAQGTPSWIFDQSIVGELAVKPVTVQLVKDNGLSCFRPWDMGCPADSNYIYHYFEMWKAAAAHLKEKNAYYRALAYVKPSGLNEISPENKLPHGCNSICNQVSCNDKAWAEAGYTPNAVYSFYRKQTAMLAEEFPEKYMSYMLIQAGFPIINNYGEYKEPLTEPLPGGLEQTLKILENGRIDHGLRFVVQHNGVGIRPVDRDPPLEPCPNEGVHPAVPPFALAGMACPNRFVLFEGYYGQITAFQTNNAVGDGVANPVELESAFRNLWDNSDGIFFEIYEQRFWEAEMNGAVLDPSATGRTISDWTELIHQRRREMWPQVPDPFPMSHRHVFKRNSDPEQNQLHYYVNSSKTSTDREDNNYGAIVVLPSNENAISSNYIPGRIIETSPNPFGELINFKYILNKEDYVNIRIYNMIGQCVSNLVNARQVAGEYNVQWKGVNESNQKLSPGIFIYEFLSGNYHRFGKIILGD